MAETLIERLWAWLHATFPERQVYIRSDGRVQFFTFGPTLQATLAGLSLIFLGWVAFASVNVIFKDRIIAAKDHRNQLIQTTYEKRLADLQVSYDELNSALVSAEDTFKSTADQLETKQRIVAKLLGRKEAVDRALAKLEPSKPLPTGTTSDLPAPPKPPVVKTDQTALDATIAAAETDSATADSQSSDMETADASDDGSVIGIMPDAVAPQPRTAKPAKASFLDAAVERVRALFFPKPVRAPSAASNLPAVRMLAKQTGRLKQMNVIENSLLAETNTQIVNNIADIDNILHYVGIKPSHMIAQVDAEGVGGPYVPISALHIDGVDDPTFTKTFADASAHVKELDTLFAAFRHVPLTTPVHGSNYELTSDFGPRIDPFTHRVGFHPGMDFGGPWGSMIHATAPGKVVWAGRRGGYGKMVEIDHGFGIRTRYGHMSSILVKVGETVKKGTPIGKLGSTGRSTGPHVHYEVWLGNAVRNPSKFIEAGRHVLQ